MNTAPQAWFRATCALKLLAVDPAGLGGLVLRARTGPVRQAFLAGLDDFPMALQRIGPETTDEALFGGIDVALTLAERQIVYHRGLAGKPGALLLGMAERCPASLAARLAQVLDASGDHCVIACDEGADPDEHLPNALADRLAFHADLVAVPFRITAPTDIPDVADARARLPGIKATDAQVQEICALAVAFGVSSLRAPIFALAAARAHAALNAQATVTQEDLQLAAELVIAPRATRLPDAQPDAQPDQPDQSDIDDHDGKDGKHEVGPPDEMLVDAVRACIPDHLMQALQTSGAQASGRGSGAGARRRGNRRGRPLPSRPGRPGGRARIDLVATLRSAAPWQTLRKSHRGTPPVIHPSDIRLKRYEDRSDRLIVFAVDASGSSAIARLAESKGAVELMLAEAYARRDHVALVAFRQDTAEVLLPPTRSLVQTKRRLAGLPGGGATPLAAGLKAAAEIAAQAAHHGLSPSLALLTDGRANVALDGRKERAAAASDATQLARLVAATGVPAVVVDVGTRPNAGLAALATEMNATYMPLPRADAHRLNHAISSALEA